MCTCAEIPCCFLLKSPWLAGSDHSVCINSFGLQSVASSQFHWGPRSRETENLPKAMLVRGGPDSSQDI